MKTIQLNCFVAFLVLLFSHSIFASGSHSNSHDKKKFPEISREDLMKNISSESVVLVDANGTESYKKNHLPTAINLESSDLKDKLPKDKGALIVAYCGSKRCSAWKKAANKAASLGYTNIKHYQGGLKDWKKSGLKFESVKN